MTRRNFSDLSPAETRVLALLATGLSNRAMAARLGVSQHTIRSHVAHVYAILDLHNRSDATREALRLGITT